MPASPCMLRPCRPARAQRSVLVVVERLDLLVGDTELGFLGLVEPAAKAGLARFDDAIRLDVRIGTQLGLVIELDARAFAGAVAVGGAVEQAEAHDIGATVRAVTR